MQHTTSNHQRQGSTLPDLPALEELKQKPQWVVWCLEIRDGKRTKVPYQARNGDHASTTDSATWCSYAEALDAAQHRRTFYGRSYSGVGFVFYGDYTGIDCDHCVNADGSIDAWAQEIIDQLDSYVEDSQSRTGKHIIVRGLLPQVVHPKTGELIRPGMKRKVPEAPHPDAAIEMYCEGRFFVVTGWHSEGTPTTIEERQEKVLALHQRITGTSTLQQKHDPTAQKAQRISQLSDEVLLRRAMAAKNGEKFRSLWQGNTSGYLSASEADLALCNLLAFWTRCDATQMDRLFRQSKLYRAEKWDRAARSSDPSYGAGTVSRAVEGCTDVYDSQADEAPTSQQKRGKGYSPTYFREDGVGMGYTVMVKRRGEEEAREEEVWMSNFSAEITSDIMSDDGAEQTRFYQITAQLNQRVHTFEVRAAEFGSAASWMDRHLGARGIIYTGQSMTSHFLNAVRHTSQPTSHLHYAHTGWRKIDGVWHYLHADGSIYGRAESSESKAFSSLTQLINNHQMASQATSGPLQEVLSQVSQVSQENNIEVKLSGTLEQYSLPSVETLPLSTVQDAVRASLRFLSITDEDTVTMPLYSALWRSVLGHAQVSAFLTGRSGAGKTELAALIQQHYGAAMNAKSLPGSWSSTENSLEHLLFQAKDTVVVVDDFKPLGGKTSQDALHAKADRVFRSVGNGSSRGRLTSHLEQRVARPPRCLVIATGEDRPKGQSLKARGLMLFLHRSVTNGEAATRLLECQRDAAAGTYAMAMAAYLTWLAPHMDMIQRDLPKCMVEERARLAINGHARAGTNVAELLTGLRLFLRFAVTVGAITESEAARYTDRCLTALLSVTEEAASENAHDAPSAQWLRLVRAAIAAKKAHLVYANSDSCPGVQYGWRQSIRREWQDGQSVDVPTETGGGQQIGWIDGEHIYLHPANAYSAACQIGRETSEDVTTSELVLRKFLHEDGLLASTSLGTARPSILARRRIKGVQESILHLKLTTLFPSGNGTDEDEQQEDRNKPPSYKKSDSDDSFDSEGHQMAWEATSGPSQNLTQNDSESDPILTQAVEDVPEEPEWVQESMRASQEEEATGQEHDNSPPVRRLEELPKNCIKCGKTPYEFEDFFFDGDGHPLCPKHHYATREKMPPHLIPDTYEWDKLVAQHGLADAQERRTIALEQLGRNGTH